MTVFKKALCIFCYVSSILLKECITLKLCTNVLSYPLPDKVNFRSDDVGRGMCCFGANAFLFMVRYLRLPCTFRLIIFFKSGFLGQNIGRGVIFNF